MYRKFIIYIQYKNILKKLFYQLEPDNENSECWGFTVYIINNVI